MSHFKKIFLTIVVALALFAGDAMAQCVGKTVYLQLPEGWNKTSINILWEGNIISATATTNGQWSVFTFPTAGNDAANKGFAISNKATGIDNGNSWIAYGGVNNSRFNITGNRPRLDADRQNPAEGFTCGIFGTGNEVYIYENPSTAGRTVVSTDPPNAYYFYFLPPENDDWIISNPYLVSAGSNGLQGEAMKIDQGRCGWFRMVYFNREPPDAQSLIWPGSVTSTPRGNGCGGYVPDDQIGLIGTDEGLLEWGGNEVPGCAQFFSLKEQFERYDTKTLFFVPEDGAGGWHTTDPMPNAGVSKRCQYNFAAIIYDTQYDANTSFHESPNGGSGIAKGIPKNKLITDPGTGRKKMQFNTAKDGWTEQNFLDAFRADTTKNKSIAAGTLTQAAAYDTKNIVRCYDMPFKRNKDGLWEFNSNQLCVDGTLDLDGTCAGATDAAGSRGYRGGYAPDELQTRFDYGVAVDYTSCPTCDAKNPFNGWVPLATTGNNVVSKFCYDRGRLGTATDNIANCGRVVDGSDIDNIWNWGAQVQIDDHRRNSLFCFESAPTEFTYEPGQEFFFSGDDDIWVYINDSLVIDLGGTHLAAPGYVNLDDLGLTPGERYPINIFFCDRRLNMSNVRISTGMYFSQKSGLGVNNIGEGVWEICINSESSGGSCADLGFGAGEGSSSTGGGENCGSDVADQLDFYLQKRSGEKCSINDGTKQYNEFDCDCTKEGNILTCNGGVIVDVVAGSVQLDRSKLYGLLGQYYVFAKIKDGVPMNPMPDPARITSFTISTEVVAVWDNIHDGTTGAFITNLGPRSKSTVAGKAVPVGFAAGGWNTATPGGRFNVDEGSPGTTFSLAQAGLEDPNVRRSGLQFYTDSLMENPVASNTNFKIPMTEADIDPYSGSAIGLLVLWVTGDYATEGDVEYSVNDRNSRAEDLKVKVYVPRLAFIDPATVAAIIDTTAPPHLLTRSDNVVYQTKGSDYSMISPTANAKTMEALIGTPLERAIAAYDVSGSGGVFPGKLCTTCNFDLRSHAWAEDITTGNIVSNLGEDDDLMLIDGKIVNGIAEFNVVGRKSIPLSYTENYPDTMGFFTIRGPSNWNPDTAKITVQWDSLLFYEPEVPIPQLVEIFDVNGDGIGDSLRIVYNKKFSMDSLPNYLEVFWDKDEADMIGFGKGTKDADGKYTNAGIVPAENVSYWLNPAGGINIITETNPENPEGVSVIVISGVNFSKEIKTHAERGNIVKSWSTYKHPKTGQPSTSGFEWRINDKIPAIVVSAKYEPDKRGSSCGTNAGNACDDNLTVRLSEPVVGLEDLPDRDEPVGAMREMPFQYKLLSFSRNTYDHYREGKDLPLGANGSERRNMCWGNNCGAISRSTRPSTAGDSIVYLRYKRYKDLNGDSAYTPIAGDSIKLAFPPFALEDLVGNAPNPNEMGKRIEGEKPFEVNIIRIADIDPDPNKDILGDAIERLVDEKGFFDGKSMRDLFEDMQVAILPGGSEWNTDSVRIYYPGSVGQLFRPDVKNKIENILGNNCTAVRNGTSIKCGDKTIMYDDIKFNVTAYYHTNLGNFVVKSEFPPMSCTNDVFKIKGKTDAENNCMVNENKFYLAWNLKDANKRLVGTGAYVQLYDFSWQITYKDGEETKTETYDKKKGVTEMLGVRRVKTR